MRSAAAASCPAVFAGWTAGERDDRDAERGRLLRGLDRPADLPGVGDGQHRAGRRQVADVVTGEVQRVHRRTQKDTLALFGGEYPGGALYSTAAWVGSHEKDVQALTTAIVNTLS